MNTFPVLETSAHIIQHPLINTTECYLRLKWGVLFCDGMNGTALQGPLHLSKAKIRRSHEPRTLVILRKKNNISLYTSIYFSTQSLRDIWFQALIQCARWKISQYYMLEGKIGAGTYGQVFKAIRLADKAEVALKVIKSSNIFSFDEFEIMSHLNHPSLMSPLDILIGGKESGVALPFMDCDLLAFMDKVGPFSENQARNAMQQILEGVEHMHSKRIAHRDLKLSNILMSLNSSGDANVQIGDFGAAAYLPKNQKFTESFIPTTPISLAPEQVLKDPYGLEADIFSCGGIMFELLTGVSAYDYRCKSIHDLHARILSNRMAPVPEGIRLSVEAQDLIGKMTQLYPHIRVTASEALSHRWFNK